MKDTPGGAFLVTDFLDLSSALSKERGTGLSLASKLATLHEMVAPTPEGFSKPVFGFPVTTCCGDTAQPNGFNESWADFYAENRLLAILKKSERINGDDRELRSLVEKIANDIVPKLLGDEHLNNGKPIRPVVVHGDLWSGNKGKGIIGGKGGVEEVVFDSSSCYAVFSPFPT